MKALLLRLWARISRKLSGKPQQMELNLWTRRSRRSIWFNAFVVVSRIASRAAFSASSMRCIGSVRRAAIQSISRSLFHWKPLADALDAKVQSSDLFCERHLLRATEKRFVVRADEELTAFLELESVL